VSPADGRKTDNGHMIEVAPDRFEEMVAGALDTACRPNWAA